MVFTASDPGKLPATYKCVRNQFTLKSFNDKLESATCKMFTVLGMC
jgi:hypothetical protein